MPYQWAFSLFCRIQLWQHARSPEACQSDASVQKPLSYQRHAALATKSTVTVGGQTVSVDSTVVKGRTYIDLKQLQDALKAAGGANQGASVTGCLNEALSNSIWSLRVTKVEAATNPDRGDLPAYHLAMQLTNGTTKTLASDSTGILTGNACNVFFADGNSITAPVSSSVRFQAKT